MAFIDTKLFEFVLKSHKLINMPPKWYIDIGHKSNSNDTVIGFHFLGPYRDDLSRAIEKQIILTSDIMSLKKGKRRITVTTTMNNGLMSKAMIQLLHYQSLKVSNMKISSTTITTTRKEILSPKKETGHKITSTSDAHTVAAMTASQVETSRSSKEKTKRKQHTTATICDKRVADNDVEDNMVDGKYFRTSIAARDDKYETRVIGSNDVPNVRQIRNRRLKRASNWYEHKKVDKDTSNKMQPDPCQPHVCDICGLAFRLKHTLTMHYRMHTGHKPFVCEICGDTFSCTGNRSIHMRIHTGYRPHVCNLCGFAFNQSHVLTEHMRLHTGERPYECGLCDMAFVSSGLLRKHTIRKHNNRA